jgi:hypothetical protein
MRRDARASLAIPAPFASEARERDKAGTQTPYSLPIHSVEMKGTVAASLVALASKT